MLKIVRLLFLLVAAIYALTVVLSLIAGEPVRPVSIALSVVFMTLAIVVSGVIRKKSSSPPGPPAT